MTDKIDVRDATWKKMVAQNRADKKRIAELEATMKIYTHCRHACGDCFCTKEARAVM
jgi:hypothetical protein